MERGTDTTSAEGRRRARSATVSSCAPTRVGGEEDSEAMRRGDDLNIADTALTEREGSWDDDDRSE